MCGWGFPLTESAKLLLSDKCKAEFDKIYIFALVDSEVYEVFLDLSLFFFGNLENNLCTLENGCGKVKLSYLEMPASFTILKLKLFERSFSHSTFINTLFEPTPKRPSRDLSPSLLPILR